MPVEAFTRFTRFTHFTLYAAHAKWGFYHDDIPAERLAALRLNGATRFHIAPLGAWGVGRSGGPHPSALRAATFPKGEGFGRTAREDPAFPFGEGGASAPDEVRGKAARTRLKCSSAFV